MNVSIEVTIRDATLDELRKELDRLRYAGYGSSTVEFTKTGGMAATTCKLTMRKTEAAPSTETADG